MKLKIDKKDCLLKDLKIPKGYRLIKDWEVLREIRTNKKLKQLCIDGYIWTNSRDNKVWAVGFDYDDDWFHVVGDWVGHGGFSRRVLVKN